LKISVIGTGAQGSSITFILAKISEAEVVAADINLDVARKVVDSIKSDKVSAERVDAGKVDDLLRVVRGSDTVINATIPRFNLNIMNAALKSGACYVDIGSGNPVKDAVIRQLALDNKFKDAELTAVVYQGGPYATQVAIRYAVDRLDRVDEILMRLGWTEESEEFIPTWAPDWCPEVALTEWIDPPTIYENGKFKEMPPFSGVEEYPFPEPVGPITVCHVDYPTVRTLARFIGKGVKYIDYKSSPDKMAGALIKMGLASDKPINVKGVQVAPRDVLLTLTPPASEITTKMEQELLRSKTESYSCSLAEVKGEKDGEKITHTVYRISSSREDYERWGTTGAGVAIPTVVTATMLAKGEIKTKGVMPTEGLEPEPFLARLAEKGWIFQERITREIRA